MQDNQVETTIQKSVRAYEAKEKWKSVFDDIYRYILPYRRTEDGEVGASRRHDLFDSTAVYSAFRFAGRFQERVTPPNTVWAELCAGPLFPEDKKDDLKRQLAFENKIFRMAIDTGQFHTASMEMYMDYVAGTGVLFVLEGDDPFGDLIDYIAAPFSEVATACNAKGQVSEVHWKKDYSAKEIYDAWPQYREKMSEALKKAAKEGKSTTKNYEVLQSICHQSAAQDENKRWKYQLIVVNDKTELMQFHSRTCPAVVPRFFMLPGEDIGRGPAMIVLPNVMVANKQVELILMAGALALFGVFTVTDDGIINPDKAQIEAGGMIMVESNSSGAYNGRSIEQLNLPNNFNISDLILQDQRAQIKNGLMDDQLPPEAGAVRSPTEIIARQRSQDFDISVAFGRITSEYIVKLYQRVEEILHKKDLLNKDLRIDQRNIMVKPVGPLAMAQNLAEVERIVQTLEISAGIGGQEMSALVYKLEEILPRVGELMGVDMSLQREGVEKEKLMEMIAQFIAQAQAQAQAQGQPGIVENAMESAL